MTVNQSRSSVLEMAISLSRQSSTMEVIAFLKQVNLDELVDDFEGKKLAFFFVNDEYHTLNERSKPGATSRKIAKMFLKHNLLTVYDLVLSSYSKT